MEDAYLTRRREFIRNFFVPAIALLFYPSQEIFAKLRFKGENPYAKLSYEEIVESQYNRILNKGRNKEIRLTDALDIVEKYEQILIDASLKYNVPQDVSIAVAALENGGGINLGRLCKGIMQIGPTVAEQYGILKSIKVTSKLTTEKLIYSENNM